MNDKLLLVAPDTNVTCPSCKQAFSLEQGFARQALEAIEASSQASLMEVRAAERDSTEQRAKDLALERERTARGQADELRQLLKQQAEDHAKALSQVREITANAFQPQLEALKFQVSESQLKLSSIDQREAALAMREKSVETRVQEAAAIRAAELLAGERQSYEKRLSEAHGQLQLLRSEQLELREERQKLHDEKSALALEVRKQVDDKLREREIAVRAQEQERATLEKAELQKKLDDVSGQLTEAQRKMTQGSQQLQGEVLELAIEDALARTFPMDTVEEVKKGVRGGDVIQRVITRTGQAAGTILWETKRAKDWSPQWIAKLREDMRGCGAEVGVLVTMPTAIPREWQGGQLFALHEDVWVTVWAPALQLGTALRAALLDVFKQKVISAGKGEHMEAVYDYLTSPQFAQKLKAVYSAFNKMREELESERSSTLQRWARREKQLQGGMAELLGVAGELQGLAHHGLAALEMELEHERLGHNS